MIPGSGGGVGQTGWVEAAEVGIPGGVPVPVPIGVADGLDGFALGPRKHLFVGAEVGIWQGLSHGVLSAGLA